MWRRATPHQLEMVHKAHVVGAAGLAFRIGEQSTFIRTSLAPEGVRAAELGVPGIVALGPAENDAGGHPNVAKLPRSNVHAPKGEVSSHVAMILENRLLAEETTLPFGVPKREDAPPHTMMGLGLIPDLKG